MNADDTIVNKTDKNMGSYGTYNLMGRLDLRKDEIWKHVVDGAALCPAKEEGDAGRETGGLGEGETAPEDRLCWKGDPPQRDSSDYPLILWKSGRNSEFYVFYLMKNCGIIQGVEQKDNSSHY